MKKKHWIVIVLLVLLVVGAIALTFVIGFLGFLFFGGIMPTDVKIYNTLNENEEWLSEIEGVVGAGIARNESDNHIIGIAVYVEDNMTNAQKIPSELGDFEVFVKKISETSELEREKMIIFKRAQEA